MKLYKKILAALLVISLHTSGPFFASEREINLEEILDNTLLNWDEEDQTPIATSSIRNNIDSFTTHIPIPTCKINTSQQLLQLLDSPFLPNVMVKQLLRHLTQQTINLSIIRDSNGDTPLHLSAYHGHTKIADFLLQQKINPNSKNNEGRTPLHLACWKGHQDVTQLLLRHKAHLNVQDNDGLTPLHLAAIKGHQAVVKLLLIHNAHIDLKDKQGKTPLFLTAFYHPQNAELLLQYNANPNVKDSNGSTHLNIAILYNDISRTRLLIKYGAQGTAFDTFYTQTLMHLACAPNKLAITPAKIDYACILIAHKKVNLIKDSFPVARFTPLETQQLITHLGYMCPKLDTSTCAAIVWHLPVPDNKTLKRILAELPLEKQKVLLTCALHINNLSHMHTQRNLCDVKFKFQ